MLMFSRAMAVLLKSLYIILLLSASTKQLASAQEPTEFVFNGFNEANLSLSGIAKIHPNGLLELTNTSQQQIGHAFFQFPLNFTLSNSNDPRSSLSFSTNFVFAMVPESPTLGGHGIAFTISPSTEFAGATATQYLGLYNSSTIDSPSNHIVSIELDTVRNPEFEDINDNHVGVNVNNLTSIIASPAMYYSDEDGVAYDLRLKSGSPMQVWIEYSETEKLLNVTLAPVRRSKPKRPLLSTNIDLSLFLLDSMYVGFSSSTGSVTSQHYILGWSFNKSRQLQSLDISRLPSLPSETKSKDRLAEIVAVSVVTAAIILLVTVWATMHLMRRRYKEIYEDWEQQYGPQRFSYRDLHKATKGFKDKELLGSGGFGKVYRGILTTSNVQIAVKKVSRHSKQGMKEFIAEIASMGRLRHRNLVHLQGYCRRKGELFLVYDYMPNGSLDKFLFSNEKPNLSWVQRYQILKGVASALLYLHEGWEQVVIHRDVKASNVLLDSDLNGRLGDFGLAKFYDHGSAPQTTRVVGTVGYLAPELIRTGKATTSSDVFAFGTFMLEVACGRKPVESQRLPEEVVLIDWVLECWKRNEILEVSDPRLAGNYVVEEMELVLKLGVLCTRSLQAARPGIRQVMQYLDGNASLSEDIDLVSGTYGTSIGFMLPAPSHESTSRSFFHDADSILCSGR